MSQYVNFFIRHNDTFIPIADFCRGTPIYEVMGDAPYEGVRKYSHDALQVKIYELQQEKTVYQTQIDSFNRRIELICKMENNSVEEKNEAIGGYEEAIEELQNELQGLERQAIELDIIADMTYLGHDIYAGVEIYDPTLENIVADGR